MLNVVGIEKLYDRESRSFIGVRLHCMGENPDVEGLAVEGIYCRDGYVDYSNVRLGDNIVPVYRYNKLQGFQVLPTKAE